MGREVWSQTVLGRLFYDTILYIFIDINIVHTGILPLPVVVTDFLSRVVLLTSIVSKRRKIYFPKFYYLSIQSKEPFVSLQSKTASSNGHSCDGWRRMSRNDDTNTPAPWIGEHQLEENVARCIRI